MNTHARGAADTFSLNSNLVKLGLNGLKDEDAAHRMRGGEGSSITSLVEHLLDARRALLNLLGGPSEGSDHRDPTSDASASGTVGDLRERWNQLADHLANTLAKLEDSELLAPHEGFPMPDQSVRGALVFRAWHESYHVGQIGMILTELGSTPLRDRLLAQRNS